MQSRILLIEDHPLTAQITRSILMKLACQVETAANGTEALEKAIAYNYDLIFMDIGLPDMNGNEVARRIRAFEAKMKRYTPIIALTAHVDENKEHCIAAGMDAVYSKPLAKEEAVGILDTFIPERNHRRNLSLAETQQDKWLMITGQPIDLALGAELIAAGPEIAITMIKKMVKQFAEEKEQLDVAYQNKDWVTLQKMVHKLRGGMAYCGTPRLQQAAEYLENCLRAGEQAWVGRVYEQFLQEMATVNKIIHS